MNQQSTILTETQYRERRHILERELADAEAELGNAALQAEIAQDPSIGADAKSRVEALRGRLESLELARSQSGQLAAAAEVARREKAKIERARLSDAALTEAATRAANIQRLMTKLRVEIGLYKEATAEAVSAAYPLGNGGPVADMLRQVAFFPNPEEGLLAVFIHSLGMKGIADIDGRSATSALGEKTWPEVFSARYGAVIALIESVLDESEAKAA